MLDSPTIKLLKTSTIMKLRSLLQPFLFRVVSSTLVFSQPRAPYRLISSLASLLTVTSGLVWTAKPTVAATLNQGWLYTIDNSLDGLGVNDSGVVLPGSVFEIYSMAIKDDPLTNSITVAINSNLPVYGKQTGPQVCTTTRCFDVSNSNIGWGDLILDFSGLGNLQAANNSGQLYGIRFAPTNDSASLTVGVYDNVRLRSVTTENAGYSNFANHNAVTTNLTGNQATVGDLAWNDSYFGPYTFLGSYSEPESWMPNVIESGNKIGEIALLAEKDLVEDGFDPTFGSQKGEQVFGLRFAKSLLPVGEFIASLITECVNDAIALISQLAPSPPPAPPTHTVICPVKEGQLNPLLPDQFIDGLKVFNDVPSGQWYDPPGTMGFTYTATEGTSFYAIGDFPCGTSPTDGGLPVFTPYSIIVNGQVFGPYYAGDTFDFTNLFPGGVTEFSIVGIQNTLTGSEWVALTDNLNDPFAVQLAFNQPEGNFTIKSLETAVDLPVTDDPVGPIPDPPKCSDCEKKPIPEPSAIAGLWTILISALTLYRRKPKQTLR
ncbi:XDD3 family exosortase-dependent surface protein [Trichocoleus sp. FACHB-262]|uniref:XDD3 family exosortase-dependent surface protein n=1 Tax=Trichocoleus sp. FACHB-262 TaxID=2692869 RepID=UPI00168239CE|nr:XDD3 family exosortase-dependent surface protein [Trichocoleus sp. FACHB-262]MBD2121871.1 hypothetical protein [Trichocoleus sp. FACHB-262]